MHTSSWKRGLAAVLATGLLAAGATAQEGASEDVTIKDQTLTTTTTAEVADRTDSRPVKPTIVDRDPFVNQSFRGVLPTTPATRVRPVAKPVVKPTIPDQRIQEPEARPGADPIATETEVPIEVPAPEVTVNGIVTSPSGSLAIISTSVGTRMIAPGEKLGDYRVSAIGTDYVAFRYSDYKVFKVPMESEF